MKAKLWIVVLHYIIIILFYYFTTTSMKEVGKSGAHTNNSHN